VTSFVAVLLTALAGPLLPANPHYRIYVASESGDIVSQSVAPDDRRLYVACNHNDQLQPTGITILVLP
jgi:hypothetical protein